MLIPFIFCFLVNRIVGGCCQSCGCQYCYETDDEEEDFTDEDLEEDDEESYAVCYSGLVFISFTIYINLVYFFKLKSLNGFTVVKLLYLAFCGLSKLSVLLE